MHLIIHRENVRFMIIQFIHVYARTALCRSLKFLPSPCHCFVSFNIPALWWLRKYIFDKIPFTFQLNRWLILLFQEILTKVEFWCDIVSFTITILTSFIYHFSAIEKLNDKLLQSFWFECRDIRSDTEKKSLIRKDFYTANSFSFPFTPSAIVFLRQTRSQKDRTYTNIYHCGEKQRKNIFFREQL